MSTAAEAIFMGRLSPAQHCEHIDPISFDLALTPAEPGWSQCTFSFALNRNQLHVVANFAHEDDVDRGHAVAKMRRTARNLVNWFLIGQTLFSDSSLSFGPDQVIAKYLGDKGWTIHMDSPSSIEEASPVPTAEHIHNGGSILPYVAKDSLLLYALQDYAMAIANPEFSLFLLWRSIEWMLWAYDSAGTGHNPAYAPAEQTLSLPQDWLSEIAPLAHNYARHARHREQPDPKLVDAARARVKTLILRHLRATHSYPDPGLVPVESDALTGWKVT